MPHPDAPLGSFSAPDLYFLALGRLLIEATSALDPTGQQGANRRRLVNLLRGNLSPAPDLPRAAADFLGILEPFPAAWLHDAIDRLQEEEILHPLEPETPRGALVPAPGAIRQLGGLPASGRPLQRVFPAKLVLGAAPRVETRLWKLRSELAAHEGRAAYGVFPNRTLACLAARRPRTLADLAEVPGLGARRIERYGAQILAALWPGRKNPGAAKQRRAAGTRGGS